MSDKLRRCVEYMSHGRGYGHTEAMIKGAEGVDNSIIVAVTKQQAREFQRRLPKALCITIDELDKLRGLRRPMLIDHYALQSMLSELEHEHSVRVHELLTELRKEKP